MSVLFSSCQTQHAQQVEPGARKYLEHFGMLRKKRELQQLRPGKHNFEEGQKASPFRREFQSRSKGGLKLSR